MLSTSVSEVKSAIQTLQDDVQLIKAELGEIKAQLETLTALFQQCQCAVASKTLPAVGNDQLAVVPSDGHQAWNNSAGSGAASSTGWSAGWAGWQQWDSFRQAGRQAWQADSNGDLEEIPFPRPTWKLPCPCLCLYAGKECDESTEATYFVYFKSRNHRKNETLCKDCAVNHRDELSGIMKMDF